MSFCCGQWYICPTTGEDECQAHGGFDSCCSDLSCPGTLPYAHLVDKLAVRLHQAWRRENGGPTYAKLSEDEQVKYLRAAWRGLRQVEKRGTLERTAELIHEDWIERHGEEGEPVDRLPYLWLPEAAKDEVRSLALSAAKIRGLKLAS